MTIAFDPPRPQMIVHVNANTCSREAQKCLDKSTKAPSNLKAGWLGLAECWIKAAEELTN